MASSGSSHLEDIDEKFCQCSICLQQYREPKLLPCLHRYCSDCLKQLIESNERVTVISCPECRFEVTLPTEGVDGFKTDFYMKSITEYVQLQKSLEPEQLRECCDCLQKLKVTAYCFKCTGFLCKHCHENHVTKRTLKDHMQHTLSLKDLTSKHMTVEKLGDLKEAPRCQSHLNDLCLLCCRTCNDLPICVTCTYGSHKNHDINDVGIIAAERREKLTKDLKNLSEYKGQVLKLPQTVEGVKEKLISNVRQKKENFTVRYERSMQAAREEMKKKEQDLHLTQAEIESKEKTQLKDAKKQLDDEMNQVKRKFDRVFNEIKEKSRVDLENLRRKSKEEFQESREKISGLELEYETYMENLYTGHKDGLFKLENTSQQIDNLTERYENLIKFGYSVLETRNDWTAVQCIPDICKAIGPLREDMKREFPELKALVSVEVSPIITEDKDSPMCIAIMKRNGWYINGITRSGDNTIVITGRSSKSDQTHITFINIKGKVLHQTDLNYTSSLRHRYCSNLSEFKVATVCKPREIGIYDRLNESYINRNIRDVVESWPLSRWVTCITVDSSNRYIFVGGYNSREVYVFDEQLIYLYTVTLPMMIRYPCDMTFSEGNLLVCDDSGKRAYVVSIDEHEGKLVYEFPKPDFDRDDWKPVSACTDSNGNVYILWTSHYNLAPVRRVIAQYDQCNRQLIAVKQIRSNNTRCIETLKTEKAEKLLCADLKGGNLHIYSIT